MDAPAFRIDPPAFLRDPAFLAVAAALPEARAVGGCVRDAIAGLAVADIDLATPRTPEAVTEALSAAGIAVVPTDIAQMAAVLCDVYLHGATARRFAERLDRHDGVVRCRDDRGRQANRAQPWAGTRARVVLVGRRETGQRRGDPGVEVAQAPRRVRPIDGAQVAPPLQLANRRRPQGANEMPIVRPAESCVESPLY